jgi:hypothetical protein
MINRNIVSPMPTSRLMMVRVVIYLRTSSVREVIRFMMDEPGSMPRREGVGKAMAALIINRKITSANPN